MHPRSLAAFILFCCTAGFTAGCHVGQEPPPGAATAISQAQPVQNLSSNGHVAAGERADLHVLRDDLDILLQLDIYQLTVPVGAISTSERFWKHIDEDHVDTATHALLLKNGVRFGIGPNDEWTYYKSLIDHYGATAQKGSTAPVKKGSLELPMRSGIDFQDIFFLTDHWRGRSYEKCDNLLALTFEPTPRHPGDATIQVCAMVRGLRKQFEVTILNDTREIELRHPEYLYDMRLRQNVPMDHFLVLAPSPLCELPDNLGHTFFVKEYGPQPTETVLILVPRPYRITGEAPNIPLARIAPAPQ
jgi:hypothetical protein